MLSFCGLVCTPITNVATFTIFLLTYVPFSFFFFFCCYVYRFFSFILILTGGGGSFQKRRHHHLRNLAKKQECFIFLSRSFQLKKNADRFRVVAGRSAFFRSQ